MYLGTDPDRDIMLEILIDKTLLDSESSPFADIRAFSTFPEEEEVLLSMGIMLQVQSVTSSPQKKNMYIQARLCYEEDAELKELKAFILEKQLYHGQDESYYMKSLANSLLVMGDQEKIEQFMKLIKPGTESIMFKMLRAQIKSSSLIQCGNYMNMDEIDHEFLKFIPDSVEMLQDAGHNPCIPNGLREVFLMIAEYFKRSLLLQSTDEIINCPTQMLNQLMPLFLSFEKTFSSLQIPSSHPLLPLLPLIRRISENAQGNHVEALKHFETSRISSSASSLNENHPLRQTAMIAMAQSAAALDDNRSLQILEDLHISGKPQAGPLLELAAHYAEIGDMSMAIVYYRAVIDDCNLPPNSLDIVNAYRSIGLAFYKLDDIELALSNCHRARELLLKHHPPTHPLLTDLQMIISPMEGIQTVKKLLKSI